MHLNIVTQRNFSHHVCRAIPEWRGTLAITRQFSPQTEGLENSSIVTVGTEFCSLWPMPTWGNRVEAPRESYGNLREVPTNFQRGNPHQSPRKSLSLSLLSIWGSSSSRNIATQPESSKLGLKLRLSCEEHPSQVLLCILPLSLPGAHTRDTLVTAVITQSSLQPRPPTSTQTSLGWSKAVCV